MKNKFLNFKKSTSVALAICIIATLLLGSFAFFSDRVDNTMNISTASFDKDGYKISREYNDVYYKAGEDIKVTVTEDNGKPETVKSVVTMSVEWASPDTNVSLFGNSDAADNVTISVDGTPVTYLYEDGHIVFDLPDHKMDASATGNERKIVFHIPESLQSTGKLNFNFESVRLTQVTSMGGNGFSATITHDELNSDASNPMDFTAKVIWDFSKDQDKSVIGYLSGSNGNFGIKTEGSGAMYDWVSGTASKHSNYKETTTSLDLSSGLTSIGDHAFDGFSKITSLTIPEKVKTIGDSAFKNLSINDLTIPSGVSKLGEMAFGNIKELTEITFNGNEIQFPAAGEGTGAFYVGTPYSESDPLRTKVNANSSDVLAYNWTADHRGYVVTVKEGVHGDVSADPTVAINGKTITLTSTPDTGYLYDGATVTYKDENGSSQSFDLAADALSFKMPASDVIVISKWAPISYSIKYDANTGTGTMTDSEHIYDAEKALTKNTFTKTGYEFIGWAETKDGDVKYADEAKVENLSSTNGDTITLYAKWEAIKYEVAYNANGGTGTMANSKHTYDVEKALTKNAFERTGYTFAGWAESKDGAVKYTDQQSVKNLASTNGAVVNLYAKWNANTNTAYKVQHWQQKISGGDEQNSTNFTLVAADTQNLTGTTGEKVTPAVKSYTGFTAPETQTVTIAADGSTVVNYYYTRNSYTVTLNKDVGISAVNGAGEYQYGEEVSISATLKSGYFWDYWVRGDGQLFDDMSTSFTMPAKDIVMNACSGMFDYFINYDLDGGSIASDKTNPTSYTVTTETFTLNNPVKTGYSFNGWTGSNGTIAQKTVSIEKGSTGNKSYVANWTANTYSVKYNANGGTGTMANSTHTYDVEKALTKNAFVRTGYTFAGWAESEDGAVKYVDEQAVKNLTAINGDTVNLYAKWTPISYTVKYNANGGTGTMADSSHTYDVEKALTKNAFERTGYTFAGWAESKDGAVKYTDQQSVKNLASTNGAVVNLYAKWNANSNTAYKVQHWQQKINGGDEHNSTNFTIIANDTQNLTGTTGEKVTPAVKSYTGFTAPEKQTVTVAADGSTVVNYYYTRNSYIFTLGSCTGANTSGSSATGIYKYGETITLKGAADKGYTWINWTSSNSTLVANPDSANDTFTMPAGNIAMTPAATLNSYSIDYKLNGGALAFGVVNRASYNVTTETFTLNNPAKTGYTFKGWTGSNGDTAQMSVSVEKGSTGNKAYEANWTANIYSVKYNANGGTGTMANSTHTYDVEKALTKNAFVRTGYTFAGWAESEDGAVKYTDEQAVKNLTATNGGTVNLYAKWTPITYTVKYNANGGTGTMADSSHTYDVEKALTKNAFTRTGYTFAGWAESKDGAVKYTDQQSVKNLASTNGAVVNLYAKWNANENTAYKVQHWQQNLTGGDAHNSTNFTLVTADTENLSGITGEKVTPAVKSYTGFTAPDTQTVTIAADGSTVVNYYYTRNSYTVTLNKGTGIASVTGAGAYKYGASVTINATVSSGYKWSNWTGTHSTTTQKYTFTMPAKNVTDTANAEINKIAQAIYSATDKSLTFIYDVPKSAGDSFVDQNGRSKTVTKVYTGFESAKYEPFSTPWASYNDTITSVAFRDEMKPVSTANWFYGFSNCSTFDVAKLNTSQVSDMSMMFSYAGMDVTSGFTISGMDNWNTSNVTNMYGVFYLSGTEASTYNIGNLSSWNTSNVTTMAKMFSDAGTSATTLNIGNLGNWNVSKVTSMSDMFAYCGAYSTTFYIGDLSGWTTSKVTDMEGMFISAGMSATTFNIGNLNNWDVSNVTNMGKYYGVDASGNIQTSGMFAEAGYSAKTFNIGNLSGWNTSKVMYMGGTFCNTGRSASYYMNLSGWNVSNVVDSKYFNYGVQTKVIAPKFSTAVAESLDLTPAPELPEGVTLGEAQSVSAMPDVAKLNEQAVSNAPENTELYGWLVDSGMAKQIVVLDEFEEILHSVYDEEPEWEMSLTPLYQEVEEPEVVEYTVTFEADGGTMPEDVDDSFIAEDTVILPVPTKDGYTFSGWYESEDLSGDPVTEFIGGNEDKTFYAKWETDEVEPVSEPDSELAADAESVDEEETDSDTPSSEEPVEDPVDSEDEQLTPEEDPEIVE